MTLTGKQKRSLRGIGHSLEPVVYVGKFGIGGPQLAAFEQALLDHELIKVKLGKGAPFDTAEMIRIFEKETRGVCVQKLGRTALFYAPHPEKPVITLPKAAEGDDSDG